MARKNQPVQVQRVGLSFLKHYALRLPFVALYIAFLSTAIMREADAINAEVLAWLALGFGLFASWLFFGSRFSLFANPFYTLQQAAVLRMDEAGVSLADIEDKFHEKYADLEIIQPYRSAGAIFPDYSHASDAIAEAQAAGRDAMTERAYEFKKSVFVMLYGLPIAGLSLAGMLPYYAVKKGHILGALIITVTLLFNLHLVGAIFAAIFAFVVPFVILFWLPIKMILAHSVQEHPFWLDWFVRGIGGPSGRFAGLREFAQRDMSERFNKLLPKPIPEHMKTSDIYLGRTPYFEDVRIAGRHVGLKDTDTHMITVARTGAGKSRDALWNTLLNYAGGLICFDPKGEHFRMTSHRRSLMNEHVYLLDPYGSVSDMQATHYWNPLDEIDIDSDAARDQLSNIAEASIYPEKGDQNAFFQENGAKIFRGFMAHVLTKYPKEEQHLGTVYDLIATGEPEGKFFSQKSFERLLAEMALNPALQGSAREAAGILMKVGDRERGSYLSTLQRGLDWINSPAIRKIITKPSTFSLREAKSKEASIYLVLPDDFISAQGRFLRTFYSLAGEVCGDYITTQPTGSQRRVLMVFDEFNALGYFRPAQEIILRKRSARIKCWFFLQNLSQLQEHYNNVENFLSSCDKQFYGVDQADTYAMEILVKALGQYTEGEGKAGQPLPFERIRNLFEASDIAQWTGEESNGQIVIPAKGKPMKLKRVPFYQNFSRDQYGEQATSA